MNRPLVGALFLAAAAMPVTAAEKAEYQPFGAPQLVTIRGYQDHAMEPFVTKDGRYLFFNNSNDPRTDTRLHWAERIDDLNFAYKGEIAGTNTPVLEGVPSLDRDGNLYFISTRSYSKTLSTIYCGRFEEGTVSGLALVAGVSRLKRGILSFDAEISVDGRMLFFADGRFTGGEVPKSADIVIAAREGNGFRRMESGRKILANINTDALEYAPGLSADLLELFFTRLDFSSGKSNPVILRATRASTGAAFGSPQPITSITGFVEAPTLSGDGRSLYFHSRDKDRFNIYRVAR